MKTIEQLARGKEDHGRWFLVSVHMGGREGRGAIVEPVLCQYHWTDSSTSYPHFTAEDGRDFVQGYEADAIRAAAQEKGRDSFDRSAASPHPIGGVRDGYIDAPPQEKP